MRTLGLGVGIAVTLGLALGACSTSNYFTLEQVTEEAVEKISFPAPTPDIDFVRARYILAGVALYGVHSVESYSGEHRTADASRILNRLVETLLLQDQFLKDYVNDAGNARFRQVLRRIETLTMVDAAIEPTRRHYRAQILGIFTSGGVSAVAAARTAFDALQGLLEVEIYRNAIVADARFHAVTLVAGPGEPSHDDAVKKVKEFREGDACKASTGPPVVDERVSARETAAKMPLVWWTYLPADMRAKICKNERVPDAAWKLILQATRVHGIDRTKIPVPDAKGWQPANDLIKMACERLTRLADLPENRNPCAPIASLKAGWQPPKVAPGS